MIRGAARPRPHTSRAAAVGRRLAGIEDPQAFRRPPPRSVGCWSRCRTVAAESSGRPLGDRSRRPRRTGHFSDDVARPAGGAVGCSSRGLHIGFEQAERFERDVEAGQDTRGLDEEPGRGRARRRHRRIGGDVAGRAQILVERAANGFAGTTRRQEAGASYPATRIARGSPARDLERLHPAARI